LSHQEVPVNIMYIAYLRTNHKTGASSRTAVTYTSGAHEFNSFFLWISGCSV